MPDADAAAPPQVGITTALAQLSAEQRRAQALVDNELRSYNAIAEREGSRLLANPRVATMEQAPGTIAAFAAVTSWLDKTVRTLCANNLCLRLSNNL